MPSARVNPAIVQGLARYLREHPFASDTTDGIARWWLPGSGTPPAADVEAALQWLVAQGLVLRVVAPDGRVRYRRDGAADDAAWQDRLHQLPSC